MEPTAHRAPGPIRETLVFWFLVFLVSSGAAAISFRVGRDWLGKRLTNVERAGSAPRIVAHVRTDSEEAARADTEAKAPQNAAVSVEDREATLGEKRHVLSGQAPGQPQGGADLSQAGQGSKASREGRKARPHTDDAAGAGDLTGDAAAADSSPSRGGRYLVTAGSYATREEAQRVVSDLTDKGFAPSIETNTHQGKTVHRVKVGVVRGRDKAQELQDELSASGVEAKVSKAE